MTPRERDPQVWAAAYALARRDDYQSSYSACDGTPSARHAFAKEHTDACAPRHIALADAAVMALHTSDGSGHSTRAYPNGTITRAAEYGETER